jgi:hypothetical protein
MPKDGDSPVSETLCVLNKIRTMDILNKYNNCIYMPLSQTFRSFLYSVYIPGTGNSVATGLCNTTNH